MLRSVVMRSALLAIACALSVVAHAYAADPKPFDVPAGDLGAALQTLVRQSGIELVYESKQLEGLRTRGLKGDFTPEEAVTKLLEGTPLTLRKDASGAMLITLPKPSLATSQQTQAGDGEGVQNASGTGTFEVAQVDNSAKAGDGTGGKGESSAESSSDESQELPAPAETGKGIPEILVLGSRVHNVDVKRSVNDAQPYYVLDSKTIEQSGAVNVEDLLKRRLTMNTTFQSNGQQVNLFGAQGAINLRGLGANETLILINGRRSANVTFQESSFQPDINGIPMAAIERIEVLPTSASAIYGGQALGGVVNIILKQNFRGGEFKYSYENLTGADAPLQNVDGIYGFSLEDGRTEITLAGHYSDGKSFLLEDRSNLAQRGISTIFENEPSFLYSVGNPFPGATPNISAANGEFVVVPEGTPGAIGPFDGLFFLFVAEPLTLKGSGTPLNASITSVASGTAPGSDPSAGLLSNAGTYNLNLAQGTGPFALQSPFGVVPRVKSFRGTVRREFTPSIDAFTEFSISSHTSSTTSNPFVFNFTVPATAPTNPFEQDVLVNFPSALSTPTETDSETRIVTVGLLARLPGQWTSELDYTWSENTFESSSFGITGTTAAFADGTLNPFVDTIANPLDLTPYLTPQTLEGSSTTLNDVGLRASGPVGSFPWGRPALTVALEHRKEGSHDSNSYRFFPDPANNRHQIFFGQSRSIDSLYAEAFVPLVTAKNSMPLLRSLDVQLAGRVERYTVDANPSFAWVSPPSFVPSNPPDVHATIKYTKTSPTIGLRYEPLQDLTFRASYAEGFLPPTAGQLLPPAETQICVSCNRITDPQNGLTYFVSSVFGGDPDLQPQTSESWNVGVIWAPRALGLEGLRLNLEYYKITQPDYITVPQVQQVVSNPEFADRVTRDPNTGLITLVDFSYLNATERKTEGWDLSLDYHRPTAIGTFGLQAVGTLVKHDLRQLSIGSPLLEYVDYPGDGGEGKTRANATLGWEQGGWALAWTTTYYSSYQQFLSPGSPSATIFGPDPLLTNAQGGFTIPSQMYHDLFASYTFADTEGGAGNWLSNLTVQVGVKNLFDTLPPFDARLGPYYYSPYGDARLRTYRLVVRKSF